MGSFYAIYGTGGYCMEETSSNSVSEDHPCLCEQCSAAMCLLCVHFCTYKTVLLDFYLVHLFNWYKTQISSWDEQEVRGMKNLLRKDDVVKNIESLSPEGICMSVHCITQNQVPHGVPDCLRELLPGSALCFPHPAVGCHALGMLGFDSCAEAQGKCQDRRISLWGCNILQLCCHLLCDSECWGTHLTHPRVIPALAHGKEHALWLAQLSGVTEQCNALTVLPQTGSMPLLGVLCAPQAHGAMP